MVRLMRSQVANAAKMVCAKKLLLLKDGVVKKRKRVFNRSKTMTRSDDPVYKILINARRILANAFKNYISYETNIILSDLDYDVYKFTTEEKEGSYGVVNLDDIIAKADENMPLGVNIDEFYEISVRVRPGSGDKKKQVNVHPSFKARIAGKCYKLAHTDIRAC